MKFIMATIARDLWMIGQTQTVSFSSTSESGLPVSIPVSIPRRISLFTTSFVDLNCPECSAKSCRVFLIVVRIVHFVEQIYANLRSELWQSR